MSALADRANKPGKASHRRKLDQMVHELKGMISVEVLTQEFWVVNGNTKRAIHNLKVVVISSKKGLLPNLKVSIKSA